MDKLVYKLLSFPFYVEVVLWDLSPNLGSLVYSRNMYNKRIVCSQKIRAKRQQIKTTANIVNVSAETKLLKRKKTGHIPFSVLGFHYMNL